MFGHLNLLQYNTVFLCKYEFFGPHNMTFIQVNLFTDHNQMQSTGLNLIKVGSLT